MPAGFAASFALAYAGAFAGSDAAGASAGAGSVAGFGSYFLAAAGFFLAAAVVASPTLIRFFCHMLPFVSHPL